MEKLCREIRTNLDSEIMSVALDLFSKGKTQRYVEKHCGIPRITLKHHFKTGIVNRVLGRKQKPLLSKEQEKDLE